MSGANPAQPAPPAGGAAAAGASAPLDSMHDHAVIAGFGVPGRAVAETLSRQKVPFCVIELNPATVHRCTCPACISSRAAPTAKRSCGRRESSGRRCLSWPCPTTRPCWNPSARPGCSIPSSRLSLVADISRPVWRPIAWRDRGAHRRANRRQGVQPAAGTLSFRSEMNPGSPTADR